ncbi:MAG: hypothetical protein CM15mP45_04480 [Deltaproteobacteria bacterium]|nr:MAG: hypothetical protein CM15mP45_04480 [Deltaproteobacteria bacterium]
MELLFLFPMTMEQIGPKTSDYVFEDLTFGNGKFIGVQSEQRFSDGMKYERIYSSTDGENWTLVHDPNY